MSENSDDFGSAPNPEPASADDLLRRFSQRSGIDYDALVARAKVWVEEHAVPSELGPEPLNVRNDDSPQV